MKQFRAVLYLLLVIGGGAMATYGLIFDISRIPIIEFSPVDLGLLVLASGLSLLGTINNRGRIGLVAMGVALSGLGMIFVAGLLQLDGLVYVGVATMIAAGILLYITRSPPTQTQSGDVS